MKEKTVTAFKGFDKELKCRGFQYEIGKTYTHDGNVKICNSGFHACENPFDVWSYYSPVDSKYCTVTMVEPITHNEGDSKIASAKITIDAEINFPDFVKTAINYIIDLCNKSDNDDSGYSAKIGSSGYKAKIG